MGHLVLCVGPLSSAGGVLEQKEVPKQRSGPLAEAAFHVEGKTAVRCLSPRYRNGDLRKIDGLNDLICLPVRSEINRCREKIKKATEELNEEKIKLESKVLPWRACSFIT